MHYTTDIISELELLTHFHADNQIEGIKVHSTAASDMIEAAQRLHNKGLISLPDGGYLTSLGQVAAEHAEGLLQILEVKS